MRLSARSAASSTALFAALALGGCQTVEPTARSLMGSQEVTPVVTEHSFALQCLGSLIEDAGLPEIVIQVDRIRDRTIPSRLNDRSRLSQAGEWLVVTAISKLETDRVRSTLEDNARRLDVEPAFMISGAWTQDDELLRQSGGLADLGWLTGRLRLRGERRFDYVAGDFASSTDGIVDFSTAIGVFVGNKEVDARLLVEDGVNFAEVGFDAQWADGPQLAQRRIAEAATLIHVSRHYDIDFRPCLESGWGDPARFRDSIEDYASMSSRDRHRSVQSELARLGYDPGSIDGLWGEQSAQALMIFQTDRGLPVTGELSPAVFALVRAEARRGGHAEAAPGTVVYAQHN